MSILARFDSTCPHCRQPMRAGTDRVEKLGRAWMHEHCRQEVLSKRMESYDIIQLPEARGAADRPPVVASNDRRRRRPGRRGRRA